MIDLHAHTSLSDGTASPAELVALAVSKGVRVLAVTDHDTFAGYDLALPLAQACGLDLICGIEVSTKYQGRSVHLLGYFLGGQPDPAFREWIVELQASRESRNVRMLQKLADNGVDISFADLGHRSAQLLGRPHIAACMVQKGYVATLQQAFDDYLDESASCYVHRDEPSFAEAVHRIRLGNGISSLPHPLRVTRQAAELSAFLREMQQAGLTAIEAYHSDHTPEQTALYVRLAEEFQLSVTGGSDFHGSAKPGIELGTGKHGNLHIPFSIVDDLRAMA